jgi:hypothetical protein
MVCCRAQVSENWELWRARTGWDGQIWLKKSAGMGFFLGPTSKYEIPEISPKFSSYPADELVIRASTVQPRHPSSCCC